MLITNKAQIEALLKKWETERTLSFEKIQSLNTNLMMHHYDFIVVYQEYGFPYHTHHYEIRNIADCERSKCKSNTTIGSNKIQRVKHRRLLTLEDAKAIGKNIIIISKKGIKEFAMLAPFLFPLLLGPQKANAEDNQQKAPIEQPRNGTEQAQAQAKAEMSRELKELRKTEERAKQKTKQQLNSNLDPASSILKNEKEQEQFCEEVVSGKQSINKHIQDELNDQLNATIWEWAKSLFIKPADSGSAFLPGADGFVVRDIRPPRIRVVTSETTDQLLEKGRRLQRQTLFGERSATTGRRFEGSFVKSEKNPNLLIGELQAEKKWGKVKTLATALNIRIPDNPTRKEKAELLQSVVDAILVEPDLERLGTINSALPCQHFVKGRCYVAFSPTPNEPEKFVFHTAEFITETVLMEIKSPTWNGNVGQTLDWLDEQTYRAKRRAEFNSYWSEFRMYLKQEKPDAIMGFKNVEEVAKLVKQLEENGEEVPANKQAQVDRYRRFKKEESKFWEQKERTDLSFQSFEDAGITPLERQSCNGSESNSSNLSESSSDVD